MSARSAHRPRRLAASGITLALLFGGAACSDETEDKVSDAAESAGDDIAAASDEAQQDAEDMASDVSEAAGDVADDLAGGADAVGARAQAEALRASLKGNDTANAEGVRSVAAIEQAAADLPGDVAISGVDDGDGDGLDDDGRVQVDQDGESACVILPAEGEDTTVESGAC